ncbi:MAG TPA: ATPase, partial [Thermoanaerobaculia bacterium]|nr:ATPase [Thermoanaerobaculia bacterium]
PSKLIATVSGFWPQIICNLKSLLESGSLVLAEPLSA